MRVPEYIRLYMLQAQKLSNQVYDYMLKLESWLEDNNVEPRNVGTECLVCGNGTTEDVFALMERIEQELGQNDTP